MAEMGCGLGSGERLQFQSQSVRRRIKNALSVATAQDREAHPARQSLAKQVAHERTRLADLLGSHLCVVRSVDDDAEHCLRFGTAEDCDGLPKPVHEGSNVGRRVCVNRGHQRMA